MTTHPRALLAVLLLVTAAPLAAQGVPPPTAPPQPAPAPSAEAPPGHRDVEELRVWKQGAGRVDWSAQGDWIAFDLAGVDGRRDIWVMRPDGSGEACLTCEQYDLRKESSFNPVWHPSGQYLVFQVQNIPKRLGMTPLELATPLRGAHSELWLITRDGRRIWQLTRVGERGGLVLDPHFSHEGGLLLWSERLRGAPDPWGEWAVRVGALKLGGGGPRLSKVKTYRPGGQPGLVVAQEFAPDDRGFLHAAGGGSEGPALGRFEIEGKRSSPVGPAPGAQGQTARLHPGTGKLLWASGLGLPRRDSWQKLPYRGDLWIESARDGRAGRLTFFNHPASEHFLGEALVDDAAWSPDGDRLLAHVVSAGREGVREDLYLVVLDPSYRR